MCLTLAIYALKFYSKLYISWADEVSIMNRFQHFSCNILYLSEFCIVRLWEGIKDLQRTVDVNYNKPADEEYYSQKCWRRQYLRCWVPSAVKKIVVISDISFFKKFIEVFRFFLLWQVDSNFCIPHGMHVDSRCYTCSYTIIMRKREGATENEDESIGYGNMQFIGYQSNKKTHTDRRLFSYAWLCLQDLQIHRKHLYRLNCEAS